MKASPSAPVRSRPGSSTARWRQRARTLLLAAATGAIGLPIGRAEAMVAPDGSFVHGVDIRIPPGTNGMAPRLSLTYSSLAGNGPLGVGWRINGLPAISRVSYGYGVNYDGRDTYSAEGAGRLVRQDADGSYFAETWSGGKYIPQGTCGDGPCQWILKSGSGVDMYFGGVNFFNAAQDHSSRIHRLGTSGSVRVWALAKVVNNRDQTSYEVTYARDTAGGDYYPQAITYTIAPGISAYKTITFDTESRPDALSLFSQSGFERWDRRVNLIRVSHNGRVLREYALSYQQGSGTGRTRLTSVQERGSAGGTLPPQTFTWQDGANAVSISRWMTGEPGTIGGEAAGSSQWFEGDFSGDGRTDRCKAKSHSVGTGQPLAVKVECYIASGLFFAYRSWIGGTWVSADPAAGNSQWFSGDFDGDGKVDLANVRNNNGSARMIVHRYTEIGFTNEDWTGASGQGGWVSTNSNLGGSQWFAADFNGDGRMDLAKIWRENNALNADVHLASELGFVHRRWATAQGGWVTTTLGTAQWFATDFNGDGKADLAKIWSSNGLMTSDVHVSTGSSFAMQRWATGQGGWTSSNPALGNSQWFTGDFNGDGKTDLAKIWNENGNMSSDVHLSTGHAFGMERWATAMPAWISTNVAGGSSQWLTGDFNGDGKADLSRMWGCSIGGMCMDVYPAGSGAFGMQRWATQQGVWVSTADRRWFTGDFNGDGRTDLAKFFVSNGLDGDVHLADGVRSDLLTYVNNGIQGVTRVVYSLGLPPDAVVPTADGCGREGFDGEGWSHWGSVGNGKVCGIPNTAPRALVLRAVFDNGRNEDPGRYRATGHAYSNGRIKPGGFDEEDYRARYPDVAQSSYGSMLFGMEQHYNDWGKAEGRTIRMRGADLGFEHYHELDEQTTAKVQMMFRQDFPYHTRLAQSERRAGPSGPVRLEEKLAYSSWQALPGVTGVNDYRKRSATYEGDTLAHVAVQVKTLDPYGFTTRVEDDAAEGYTIITDTTYSHNASVWEIGRVLEVKKYRSDSLNPLEWEKLRHNTAGRIDLKQRWLCSNAASCATGSWVTIASGHVYDSYGNLTSVKDARGIVTATEYDPTYRALVTRITSDAAGLAHATVMTYGLLDGTNSDTVADPTGQQTITTSDQFGRKVSVATPHGGLEVFNHVGYGLVGQQYDETVTTVDHRVVRSRRYFDGASRVFRTETTGDDARTVIVESEDYFSGDGVRHTRESRPRYLGEQAVWTEVTYDLAGRQSFVRLPDGTTASYQYGPGSASVTEQVSGNSRTTTEYFTSRGRMWQKVDPLGGSLLITYDDMQRPTRVAYRGVTQVTTTYDSFGQRRTVTDHSSGTPRSRTFTYDAAGNQLESLDPRGHRVRFTYDNLNRLLTKQRRLSGATSFTTDVTFTYDDPEVANSKGRLTKVVDPSGSTELAYDVRGLVTSRKTRINGLGSDLYMNLTHDAFGRPISMTFPNGGTQDNTYTDGGNLQQVSYNGVEYASFWNFSATGRPAVKVTPNTATSYQYDQKDLLASLVTTAVGGRQLQNNGYTYDEAGNVTAITDRREDKTVSGVNTDDSQQFIYDQTNRLVRAQGRYGGVANTVKSYGYDGGAAGAATQPPGLGNVTAFGGRVNRSLSYSGQRATSGTSFSASYDASGNMVSKTQDGQSWTYSFNYDNQLTQVKRGTTTTLDIVYNYQGQRVKKIFYAGGGRTITTYYVPGGYEVRVDSSNPGTFRRTVHLGAGSAGKVATVTTTGSTPVAAMLTSRQHWALAAASDPTSARGLARTVFHVGAALVPAPEEIRVLVAFSLVSIALLLLSAMSWRQFRGRRRAQLPRWACERRLSFASRLLVIPLLLIFSVNLTGCGNDGNRGDVDEIGSGVLASGTTLGVPAGTWFYHPSHIGGSSVMTDAAGNTAAHINYFPFGEVDQARSAGTDMVTHKFGGHELDEESGLVYYGARYYDPGIGRFISADSVVPENGNNAQAFNRYAHTENNPITYTDPTGHWSWKGFWRATLNVLAVVGVFLLTLAVVAAIVALSVMTAGAATAALGLAAGGFWSAVVAGGISGFLISGALALKNGASFSAALMAAFQGAVIGAIGGGVGQYVQGIGGVTKGLGETLAVGGARGLATGGASAYMNGARGSELVKAALLSGASGVAVSSAVYGLDKLAKAYASNEGFGMGKPNTFGNAVSTERGGAHDLSRKTQVTYLTRTESLKNNYGDRGFVEGGFLSERGADIGLNPTSQVHDGFQGLLNTMSAKAGAIGNWLTMVPAHVVANYGIIGQNHPEFFTTSPRLQVFNLN